MPPRASRPPSTSSSSATAPDAGRPARGRPGRSGARAARRGQRHAHARNRPERAAPGAGALRGRPRARRRRRRARTRAAGSCTSTGSTTAPPPRRCSGVVLTAEPLAATRADDDELWVHELIGARGASTAPGAELGTGRRGRGEPGARPARARRRRAGPDGVRGRAARRRASWSTRPTGLLDVSVGLTPCASTSSRSSPSTSTARSTRRCSAGPRARACSTCGSTTCATHATDRHRSVDDTPFGGGAGMVMTPEPLFAAVEAAEPPRPLFLLSAAGRRFDQATRARAGRGAGLLAAVRSLRGRRPAGRRPPVRRRAVGRRLRARRRRGGGAGRDRGRGPARARGAWATTSRWPTSRSRAAASSTRSTPGRPSSGATRCPRCCGRGDHARIGPLAAGGGAAPHARAAARPARRPARSRADGPGAARRVPRTTGPGPVASRAPPPDPDRGLSAP